MGECVSGGRAVGRNGGRCGGYSCGSCRAAIPLVAHGAHTIQISQGVAGGKRGVLGGRTRDRHGASGVVVDVGHHLGGRTELGLGRVCQVRIGGLDREELADVSLGERVFVGRAVGRNGCRCGGYSYGRCSAAIPLVAHGAHTIQISQRVAGGERDVLGGCAGDRHGTSGGSQVF